MKWPTTSIQSIGQICYPRCHPSAAARRRLPKSAVVGGRLIRCRRSHSQNTGTDHDKSPTVEAEPATVPIRPIAPAYDFSDIANDERVRCWDLHFKPRFQVGLSDEAPPKGAQVMVSGHIRSVRNQKERTFAILSDGSSALGIQLVLDPSKVKNLSVGTSVQATGLWKASEGKDQSHELVVRDFFTKGSSDARVSHCQAPSSDLDAALVVRPHADYCAIQVYPIQPKNSTLEQMRNYPHLRLREPVNSAMARVRSAMLSSVSHYFHVAKPFSESTRFIQVHPPLITSSDCEGAGQVFGVESALVSRPSPGASESHKQPTFFRDPQYLTVSSQLHLEAYAAELTDVWALTPTFRAEPSDTPRHLAEFYMLEVETSNAPNISNLTSRVKHFIASLANDLVLGDAFQDFHLALHLANRDGAKIQTTAQLEQSTQNLEVLRDHRAWPSINYRDCIAELVKVSERNPTLFEHPPRTGHTLNFEHERWISTHLAQDRPVFVTRFPKAIKPFYMYSTNRQDPHAPDGSVDCFDLLLPFGAGEVAGGSKREHRLDILIENMRRRDMLRPKGKDPKSGEPSPRTPAPPPEPKRGEAELYPCLQPGESLGALEWYADLRRYGTTRHGGFGLGFDRLLAFMTGTQNLKDLVAFPRSHRRTKC